MSLPSAVPIRLLLLVILTAVLPSFSAAANGKALYAPCSACHAPNGGGNRALGAPNIAGLDAGYVAKQLEDFSAGRRGAHKSDTYGAQMKAAAATLKTPADRQAVAMFVAGLARTTPPPAPKTAANMGNGKTQFNALCSACHNASGKGNPALGAPRLAGTDPVYLARQLRNFRSGVRGTHPADKMGKQMAAISKMLPNDDAERDVIAYIQTLKP
ncbi:c-type cytochrome [Arenimonas sp. GDDSR-1]|uniref:c-type cytochrome n=1 Tax=Arenimonas sp. GDDSR-1 TaxID=2950125 RepID=UPI002608E626|nr:c-type cytochrome [Arenimonas sp. GDDSR-1]